MTTITKHTIFDVDQAVRRLKNFEEPLSGRARVLLHEYAETLSRADIQQRQQRPNLLNPNSANQSEEWRQVHQLVEDITWQSLDQRLRDKLSELEAQLKEEGAF
ncbi:hypothetical protein [Enterobacter mori]